MDSPGLQIQQQPPGNRFDVFHGVRIGNAYAVVIAGVHPPLIQARLYGRTGTVYQHQPDAQAGEQGHVVDQRSKAIAVKHTVTDLHNERLTAMDADVRRG